MRAIDCSIFLSSLRSRSRGAQLQRVLFLDRRAVGGIGDDHGVLAQVLGGFTGAVEDVLFELGQLQAEERHLLLVHVLRVRHWPGLQRR
jgi:hypothetical protein